MTDRRIGFVGLGTMGAAMAGNLARGGFEVTAWNRTAGRAPELDELGVARAATPADVARATDAVVICVSDTPDVEEVLFGPSGLAAGAQGAIRLTKRALNNWMRVAGPIFDASLAFEMLNFTTDDVLEGVAGIKEKRAPKFPSAQ